MGEPLIKNDTVTVTSGPIGRSSRLIVGDQILSCVEIDIRIRHDELVMVSALVRAEHIDIEAMQSETEVTVVGLPGPEENDCAD